jgi:hypothetical protein
MSRPIAVELQNDINMVSDVLQGWEPHHPNYEQWHNQLAQTRQHLAAVQGDGAATADTSHAGLSRKRSLRLSADDDSDDTQPKRFSPSFPGNSVSHAPTENCVHDYIDLTVSDPPSPDPFPELVNAFRDDDRPAPVDAFNQEFMRADELAQFLIAGTSTPASGIHRQNPVPYLPGPQRPEWFQDTDEDSNENYGDFPLNVTEAESIERMLEIVQQNGDDSISREQTPRIMSSTLKEYQKIGLAWLLKMEASQNKGGILADEMGLGKTVGVLFGTLLAYLCEGIGGDRMFRSILALTNIFQVQALALICARPSQDPLCRTTLIIAPVALMRQWEKEIGHHIQDRYKHRVYLYHGNGKKADFNALRQHDVVLTTFGTLTSEFKQKESQRESMLYEREQNDPHFRRKPRDKLALLGHECMWYRVIIDEAHMIRNRNSIQSKATVDLQAKHRLCLTGTP